MKISIIFTAFMTLLFSGCFKRGPNNFLRNWEVRAPVPECKDLQAIFLDISDVKVTMKDKMDSETGATENFCVVDIDPAAMDRLHFEVVTENSNKMGIVTDSQETAQKLYQNMLKVSHETTTRENNVTELTRVFATKEFSLELKAAQEVNGENQKFLAQAMIVDPS